MKTSTAPIFKTALKVAVQSSDVTLPLSVNMPPRWGENSESDWVLVGTVTWTVNSWRTNRTKEESYTIEVVFNTVSTDGDLDAAEARAVAEAAKLEEYLMGNPTLGVADIHSGVFEYIRTGSWSLAQPNHVQGRAACRVTVSASVRR